MFTTELEVERFLDEYRRSKVFIETTAKATLNRALEFEQKYHKPFYVFNFNEVIEMFKSARAISIVSLQNANLLLKHASRWCIYVKQLNIQSIYEQINKDHLQQCIDVDKKESLILSQENLRDIQGELLNWTDKGILQMLFLGAGSNWLKELTFFDMSQIDHKQNLIRFNTGKVIHITEKDYLIIKKACDENELVSLGKTLRSINVRSEGLYKIRSNASGNNDNPNNEHAVERRFRFIQRRLILISKELNIPLTSGSIQTSGLLHHLKQGVQASGLSFRKYIKTDEAKRLAYRYDIFSEYYAQILLEKFEQYFV